jgi:hypothetical protein
MKNAEKWSPDNRSLSRAITRAVYGDDSAINATRAEYAGRILLGGGDSTEYASIVLGSACELLRARNIDFLKRLPELSGLPVSLFRLSQARLLGSDLQGALAASMALFGVDQPSVDAILCRAQQTASCRLLGETGSALIRSICENCEPSQDAAGRALVGIAKNLESPEDWLFLLRYIQSRTLVARVERAFLRYNRASALELMQASSGRLASSLFNRQRSAAASNDVASLKRTFADREPTASQNLELLRCALRVGAFQTAAAIWRRPEFVLPPPQVLWPIFRSAGNVLPEVSFGLLMNFLNEEPRVIPFGYFSWHHFVSAYGDEMELDASPYHSLNVFIIALACSDTVTIDDTDALLGECFMSARTQHWFPEFTSGIFAKGGEFGLLYEMAISKWNEREERRALSAEY